MSEQSNRDREERALEALIVSQLRRDRDPNNAGDLPELTDDERKVMNALGPNLIDRLWTAVDACEETDDPPSDSAELAMTGDEAFAGMNRAEEMDEETKDKIKKRRQEVLERLRKKKAEEDEHSA